MNEKVFMILFVLVLGSVLTTALVSVDAYTEPFIEKNKVRKLRTSVLKAFDIPYDEDKVDDFFMENIDTKKRGEKEFYVTSGGDVAFEISGSGFWGPIRGIVAVLPDLETIKGIAIIHQEETPGLGGRIGEADFLNRFKGKKLFPQLLIGKGGGENNVDGITGATLSCKAFEQILNTEAQKYLALFEEK